MFTLAFEDRVVNPSLARSHFHLKMFLSSAVSKQNLCTSGRNMSNCVVPVMLCSLAASLVGYLSCELFFCSYKFSYYFRREGDLFLKNRVEGMFSII